MRAGSRFVFVLAAMAGVIAGTSVSAHRLDECLQAARIAIEPTRVEVELDLTPGAAVAESMILDIDQDRDGRLSADEQRAYAERVVGSTQLEIDGRHLRLERSASTFADVGAFRRGEGTIRIRSSAGVPRQSDGAHQLVFRNTFRRDVSVYLANALVPGSDRIGVTAQRHAADQRDLTIDYVVRAEQSAVSALAWLRGIAGR